MGGDWRFTFDAPLGEAGDEETERAGEGTGLRYVRTRLREAFGSSWQLSSGPAEGYYRTEIVVPARA